MIIIGKFTTVLDFLFTLCNCSYFNYILWGLEGGVFHNLFIASASTEQPIVPLRPPSSIPQASENSVTSGEKKVKILFFLSSANLRPDFREISKPLCALLPAIGRWKE